MPRAEKGPYRGLSQELSEKGEGQEEMRWKR